MATAQNNPNSDGTASVSLDMNQKIVANSMVCIDNT